MHCRTIFFNKALVTSDYAAKAYSNSTLSLAFKGLSIFIVLLTQSCTLFYSSSVEAVSPPFSKNETVLYFFNNLLNSV